MTSAELRPLGLGDLLDRAVTLFVRRFGPLVAAIALTYVPLALLQWKTLAWLDGYKPTLTPAEWKSFGLNMVAGLLLFALTRTAAAAIAYAGYAGQTMSLRAAYRLAVLRFGAQIVTQVLALLVWLAIFIVLAIPVFVIAAIATSGGGRGTVPILIALAIAGVIGLVLGAWLFLAFELATVQIGSAAKPSYAALFKALAATAFRRPWHSLLAALMLMLVVIGGSLMFSLLAQVPSPEFRNVVAIVIAPASTTLIEALSITFLVAYDVDLAVRHQGLDIAAALEAAPQPRHPIG
ncbi:MAG TPA: hypothetical protein VGX96_20515 [Candidatus Elarobacter sp.]|jgi:hypothetical protein|nr:hypothetical protein [Candidatus Elarobacter sp.]